MKLLVVCFILALAGACGSQPPPEPPGEPAPGEPITEPPAPGDNGEQAACVASGCSGTVCAEAGNEVVTTCEWREEYACYQDATCKRQPDGLCGWSMTAELEQCLTQGGPQAR